MSQRFVIPHSHTVPLPPPSPAGARRALRKAFSHNDEKNVRAIGGSGRRNSRLAQAKAGGATTVQAGGFHCYAVEESPHTPARSRGEGSAEDFAEGPAECFAEGSAHRGVGVDRNDAGEDIATSRGGAWSNSDRRIDDADNWMPPTPRRQQQQTQTQQHQQQQRRDLQKEGSISGSRGALGSGSRAADSAHPVPADAVTGAAAQINSVMAQTHPAAHFSSRSVRGTAGVLSGRSRSSLDLQRAANATPLLPPFPGEWSRSRREVYAYPSQCPAPTTPLSSSTSPPFPPLLPSSPVPYPSFQYFARSDNLTVHSIPVPVPCLNYSSLFLNLSDPSPSKPLIQADDSTVVVLAVSPNAAEGIWRAALDLGRLEYPWWYFGTDGAVAFDLVGEGQNLTALASALQGEMGIAPYKGDYSDSSPIWEYMMHWRSKRHDIYPGLLTLDVGPSLPRFNSTRQYVPYLFDAVHAFFEAFSSIIASQSECLGGWGVDFTWIPLSLPHLPPPHPPPLQLHPPIRAVPV
ncbi:unnamed protein product [Closterium sp. NIES-53]